MKGIETFDKASEPPATALKRIGGGRLAGKTDINPQWRNRAMTDTFGLCGFGWKYTIDRQWTEPTGNGEVMAFVNISLYVKDGETWSEAIPGTGGSMLIANEKNGPYNSDEAFKMAQTDALSVAMKMIGIASAIYEGRWDGSKYDRETVQQEPAKPSEWDTWKATAYPAIRDGFGEAGKILQWTQNKMDDMSKMVKEMLKSHDIPGLKALSLDVAIQVEAQRDAEKAAKAEPVQAEIF